jgi:hypothetical protein
MRYRSRKRPRNLNELARAIEAIPCNEELGVDGLRPRSRRPLTSSNVTSGEVIGKIVHLRKTYHFGPQKISIYLTRYHDLQLSVLGVWRILRRLEMNRLPPPDPYQRHHSSGGFRYPCIYKGTGSE